VILRLKVRKNQKGQGRRDRKCHKSFIAHISWKMDRLRWSQDRNDIQSILHVSLKTFHQRIRTIFQELLLKIVFTYGSKTERHFSICLGMR